MPNSFVRANKKDSQLDLDQVVVIGLGQLGESYLNEFHQQEHQAAIFVTTTSLEKFRALQLRNIASSIYRLDEHRLNQALINVLPNSHVVLNIAPSRFVRRYHYNAFVQRMTTLIDELLLHEIRHLTFVSTTSVFSTEQGFIDHRTQPIPSSESGLAHLAIENHLLANHAGRALVIRPSGLVSEYRHPVVWLSEKAKTGKVLTNGREPTNLIHQTDVARMIIDAQCKNIHGVSINLSCLDHPLKQDYYTEAARALNLPPPSYQSNVPQEPVSSEKNAHKSHPNVGKIIDCREQYQQLGFELRYPNCNDLLTDELKMHVNRTD